MTKKQIRFGIIGCGLMGKEFASAAARWCHLSQIDVEPVIVAVCDVNTQATAWFQQAIPSIQHVYTDPQQMLANPSIDAIYCAVPHHLHEQLYIDIIQAGKHLLGEKPFGIDLAANQKIMDVIESHPEVIVRCSSEFPFFPGAIRISRFMEQQQFGKIIEVEAGFWHSSDLDTHKPINWKRQMATNGEYGCMGDLGMHVLHLPLRFGFIPQTVRALLSKIVETRPDSQGKPVPCETWDNAILACDAKQVNGHTFPMVLSTKRIAPGHANTWFIRIIGTERSIEYSTKNPKQLSMMSYQPGQEQAWQIVDVPYQSAYPTITGAIFEFGFTDSILQMWAAFCDEVVHREQMKQPFRCVTPLETLLSHKLFTAALKSHATRQTVEVNV